MVLYSTKQTLLQESCCRSIIGNLRSRSLCMVPIQGALWTARGPPLLLLLLEARHTAAISGKLRWIAEVNQRHCGHRRALRPLYRPCRIRGLNRGARAVNSMTTNSAANRRSEFGGRKDDKYRRRNQNEEIVIGSVSLFHREHRVCGASDR
jgi:hypothetical protein